MSKAAKNRLRESRVRQLLHLELGNSLHFDKGPNGPLATDIVRVWIDLLADGAAAIEVRRNGRPTAKRSLSLRGFANDVAARVVTIAAAEMVRVQAKRHRSTANAQAHASGDSRLPQSGSRLALQASLDGQWLAGTPHGWLGGSSLRVLQSGRRLGAAVFGRWLGGGTDNIHLRWFEFGLGMQTQWHPSDDWQLELGAEGGAVALRNSIGGETRSDWSATATLQLRLLHRMGTNLQAGLSLRPGLILRRTPLPGRVASPEANSSSGLGGASLGLAAVLRWQARPASASLGGGNAKRSSKSLP